MTDAYLDMWSYWRDKSGFEEALKIYFPKTLEGNTQLQVALAQLQNAEIVINNIMENLE